jgi:hypothetical protein
MELNRRFPAFAGQRSIMEHPVVARGQHEAGTRSAITFWPGLVVVLGAILTAMGAVIALVHPAMLASPHDEINGAVRIYAGYTAARNIGLAFALIALLSLGAKRALSNLLVLVGFIQILDAIMDVAESRWTVTPGVLIFGVVFLVTSVRLSNGVPFWKRAAWTSN